MIFRSGMGLLRSAVARRLLLLFLFTALLPMLVAAWLSSAAIEELSAQVDHRLLGRDTRQVGLQVFDRLLVAKGLVQSWPAQVPGEGLPGQGRLFRHIVAFDPQGHAAWSFGDGVKVAAVWRSHAGGAAAAAATLRTATPAPVATPQQVVDVRLHLVGPPGDVPAVALEGRVDGATRWLAVLEPGYLWGPMADADESAWSVQQLDGPRLLGLEPSPEAVREGRQRSGRWHLFLAAEFGATDWVFTQRRPETRAVWFGRPLEQWLALVAAATVLVVASVTLAQVRRTLGALGRLTQGTQRLAAGEIAVRVRLDTPDEFGELARSFNHMARRIELQWQSLRGLARIDRAILEGADIAAVARHVLRPLRLLGAGTSVALLWLEDPAHPVMEGLVLPSGAKTPQRWPPCRLDPAQHAALTQWQDDLALTEPARQAAELPWLAPLRRETLVRAHCYPVRWNGQTQAVLLVGLRSPLDAATLQPAADLKERLAVAFAARERDRALVHRALHDSLTGLANRHGLHERLDALLAQSGACALLFIDLDRFKQVNDTLGHAAGDELLRQASQRLARLAPAGTLVARPGGDEFVIACPGADRASALTLAQAVCTHLALPFHLGGQDHVLGASVGIAHAPLHAHSRDELMRAADLAMYAAKGAGRGRCTEFTPRLDAELRERLQLQSELRLALARDELVLHYQPRVQPSGAILSAEALVRWHHPARGLLPPGVFVPVAEESDLIEALGLWVLDAACAQMARWRHEGVALPRVSVNLSPRQLASGHLLQEVRSALERHGITPQQLELEVTESLLVGDATSARDQLAELRRWGVTIALDDFGTGYSSMSMLRELPIDVMKVDRAFVKDLGRDDAALAVTRAILALAGSMHLHTVAEGVETVEQAELLTGLGCLELQGYLYAKPLPAEAFARLPGLPRRTAAALA